MSRGTAGSSCEDLHPVKCNDEEWHPQLRTEGLADGIVSGRVCIPGQCEEVDIVLDQGWKVTDVAVEERLVKKFNLQKIQDQVFSVHGNGREQLPTYFANALLSIFVFTDSGRQHKIDAVAGRISGLSSIHNNIFSKQEKLVVVAGVSMLKAWRLTVQFNEWNDVVLHRCSPSLHDLFSSLAGYRDTITDDVCTPLPKPNRDDNSNATCSRMGS
jgi:hypothetical protein